MYTYVYIGAFVCLVVCLFVLESFWGHSVVAEQIRNVCKYRIRHRSGLYHYVYIYIYQLYVILYPMCRYSNDIYIYIYPLLATRGKDSRGRLVDASDQVFLTSRAIVEQGRQNEIGGGSGTK